MGEVKPLVSVQLPSYNSANFLDASILSVLAQSFSDWELLAYDDGSDDKSYERLQFWANVDQRIKVCRPFKKHGHYIDLCNQMLDDSEGTFVARLDADDIALPNRLERQVAFMSDKKRDSVSAIGSLALTIWDNKDGSIDNTANWIRDFIEPVASFQRPVNMEMQSFNRVIHSTLFTRRDDIIKVGGYSDLGPVEDWDLMLSLSQLGEIFVLPNIDVLKRQHNDNFSKREHSILAQQIAKLKSKHHLTD